MVRELDSSESALAFTAMNALRPHFSDEAEFVRRVNEVQRPEGYRLVGVFEEGVEQAEGVEYTERVEHGEGGKHTEGGKHAVAAAGFRILHSLAWGHYLYVDDLSTLPDFRRRGHGRRLLDWLIEEARRRDCTQLHLDSGPQAERQAAHRLYFNTGMRIESYHFGRTI